MIEAAPPEAAASAIDQFVRERLPIGSSPLHFKLLSGGNSHITWRVIADGHAGDLVVKIAQPDGPLAPYDVGHEAKMMQQAYVSGVPAPELIGFLKEGELQFLAMHLVEGDSPSLWEVRQWLEGRADGDRIGVGRSLLSTLVPLAKASTDSRSQAEIYTPYIDGLVSNLEAAASGLIELPATFQATRKWLLSKIHEHEAPVVLCHGDFRLGNAVFKDWKIAALLDWERAMSGHPLHDIGFLCLPGMKHGEHICGVMTQAELIEVWHEVTGQPLNISSAAYFKILAIFGELCLMVRAMSRLARGAGRLTGVRPLPLIARLHDDLVKCVRRWDDGDFSL